VAQTTRPGHPLLDLGGEILKRQLPVRGPARGLHVHYDEEGDPSFALLVLLHGFGDSYTSWEGWTRELKAKFHIISLDFPAMASRARRPGTCSTASA